MSKVITTPSPSRENASEIIKNSFPPVVAVLTSQDVEVLCQKNALSFCDLLLPFSKLNTEVSIKDPTNQQGSILIRNLRVDFRDIRKDGFLHSTSVLPSVLGESVREAAKKSPKTDGSTPWYDAFRTSFLTWAEPSEHEFLRHYLASVLVVSTSHANPLDQLTKLSQSQHAQQHTGQSAPSLVEVAGGPPFAATPKWFVPNIFKYYVLVHDVTEGDDKKAESVYQSMKMTYGAHACHLLRINSVAKPGGDVDGHAPDPWRTLLESKYRGVTSGVKLAKTLANGEGSPIKLNPGASFDDPNQLRHAVSTVSLSGSVGDRAGSPVPNGITSDGSNATAIDIGDPLDSQMTQSIMAEGALSPAHQPTTRSYRSESIPNALSHNDLTRLSTSEVSGLGSKEAGWAASQDNLHHFHSNFNEARWREPKHPPLGQCLSASDRDRIKIFVQEFVGRGLLGFVERQMRLLHDQVMARRGIHKSIFGKLLGRGPAGGAPPVSINGQPVPSSTYTLESGEMQMRRLADLCFLFHNYQRAFDLYQTMKREFLNDGAWFHHAGALEMAAITAFVLGPAQFPRPYPHHYMDNAVSTYMNTCIRPMQAIRSALISAVILEGLEMHNETASLFIRMTSGDSDLCSAIFLEQASRAFKRVGMDRKYALHLILAGHRYNKASDKELALACYLLAGEVYRDKAWSLAEDHINYTIGHLSQSLANADQALDACAQLLHSNSLQYPAQQEQFFRDYLRIIKANQGVFENEDPPELLIPHFNAQDIRVLYGGLAEDSLRFLDQEAACSSRFEELERKCSERLKDGVGKRSAKFASVFPVGDRILTENSSPSEVPSGEVYSVLIPVSNPLEAPIALVSPRLEWNLDGSNNVPGFKAEAGTDFVLGASETKTLTLRLQIGSDRVGSKLSVTGLRFGLSACKLQNEKLESFLADHSLIIEGRCALKTRGKRLNTSKDQRMNVVHGADFRLNPIIGPPMPLISVEVTRKQQKGSDSESVSLCGEIMGYRVGVVNISVGKDAENLLLATDPESVACVTSDSGEMSAENSVFRLEGSSRDWTLWIRAPSFPTEAPQKINLLLSYTGSKQDNMRHRVVHRSVELEANPSLLLSSQFIHSEQREALLILNCENCNKPSDPSVLSLQILRAHLFSSGKRKWKLKDVASLKKEIHLNPSEKENICILLEPTEDSQMSELWFSSETVGDIHPSVLPWPPAMRKFASGPHKDSSHMVSLLWKAHIVDAEGSVRSVVGEHWCEALVSEAKMANQPPVLMQSPSSTQISTIRSNIALSPVPENLAPPSDSLVQCSQHLEKSHIYHDFRKQRICTVPVHVSVWRKSGGGAPVTVSIKCYSCQKERKTASICQPASFGGKTQWTFPGLGPDSRREFTLSAIFTSPGIFDLSSISVTVSSDTVPESRLPLQAKFITVLGSYAMPV